MRLNSSWKSEAPILRNAYHSSNSRYNSDWKSPSPEKSDIPRTDKNMRFAQLQTIQSICHSRWGALNAWLLLGHVIIFSYFTLISQRRLPNCPFHRKFLMSFSPLQTNPLYFANELLNSCRTLRKRVTYLCYGPCKFLASHVKCINSCYSHKLWKTTAR